MVQKPKHVAVGGWGEVEGIYLPTKAKFVFTKATVHHTPRCNKQVSI
jgi:hypothetical protein